MNGLITTVRRVGKADRGIEPYPVCFEVNYADDDGYACRSDCLSPPVMPSSPCVVECGRIHAAEDECCHPCAMEAAHDSERDLREAEERADSYRESQMDEHAERWAFESRESEEEFLSDHPLPFDSRGAVDE